MTCRVLEVPVAIDLIDSLEGDALTQCIQLATRV